jgi:hypothetical protein
MTVREIADAVGRCRSLTGCERYRDFSPIEPTSAKATT